MNVRIPPSMWQLLFADVCWHDLEAAYMWPGCWSTRGSWSCSGYVRAVISVVERSIGTIKQSGSRDAIAPFFVFYLSRTKPELRKQLAGVGPYEGSLQLHLSYQSVVAAPSDYPATAQIG